MELSMGSKFAAHGVHALWTDNHELYAPNEIFKSYQQTIAKWWRYEIRTKGILLPAYSVRTLPNYPNYRLYEVPGSLCDTLGIDAPMVNSTTPNLSKEGKIQIFPNPTTGIIQWRGIADDTQTTVRIHNLLGKMISEKKSSDGYTYLEEVPDGLYFITLFGEKGHFLTTKAVILTKK